MNHPAQLRARVLCVVGDEGERTAIAAPLAEYDVVCATTGYDAIRNLNSAIFDLHIVDQWLADWGGIQFCRHVRRTDPRVPVIYLSATTGEEIRRRALNAGATVFMSKPVEPWALRGEVEALLLKAMLDNLRAAAEEERLVQEELARRAAELREISASALISARNAIERSTRIKAQKAFLDAGGTMGHFERAWQPLYAQARGVRGDGDA